MYSDQEEDDLEIIQEGAGEVIEGASGDENEDNQEGDGENEQGDGENEQGDNGEKKQDAKPKRVVRNPQPKLDFETLKGKKGLLALEEHFKNVQFKGKGHEEDDLRKILKTYEYWCHRMFPKYPFDECLSKLEKLGTKKSVQVYVKKIRTNLVFDEVEVQLENSDEEGGNTQENAESQFDRIASEPAQNTAVSLTVEQLEQIRKNREKAMRLRQERLKAAQAKAQSSLEASSRQSQDITTQGNNLDDHDNSELNQEIASNEGNQEIASNEENQEIEIDNQHVAEEEIQEVIEDHVEETEINAINELDEGDQRNEEERDIIEQNKVVDQDDEGSVSSEENIVRARKTNVLVDEEMEVDTDDIIEQLDAVIEGKDL